MYHVTKPHFNTFIDPSNHSFNVKTRTWAVLVIFQIYHDSTETTTTNVSSALLITKKAEYCFDVSPFSALVLEPDRKNHSGGHNNLA